jgi:hypothetical protein
MMTKAPEEIPWARAFALRFQLAAATNIASTVMHAPLPVRHSGEDL